ncbi:MAG: efflux RND transporter periplasmic adaptor subunit [Pseudomonadota bacterium]
MVSERHAERKALKIRHRIKTFFILVLLVVGCERIPGFAGSHAENQPCGRDEICAAESEGRVRAIKPFVVTQLASGAERNFSGEIAAANEAPLSFPVSGRIETIDVAAGDAVEKGALLATLDSAQFELNLETTQADLNAALAAERAIKTDFERQKELQRNGWVSQAALDQSQVEYENARSQVSVARSRVTLAERDLASTKMQAPFSGVISSVDADPFTEVVAGRTIMTLQSGDALEVVVSVPDVAVDKLAVGAQVAIEVGTLPLCGCVGRIVEIGAVSSAGNAVDVVVAVTRGPPELRAGMSAEVAVTLSNETQVSGYFVPLTAVAPGDTDRSAIVFRFEPDEGVVRRVPVRFVGSIAADAVAVEGLNVGDIVAAAGVSFLRDGQRVRLLGQQQ